MLSEIAVFKIDTCSLGTNQYTQWVDCDYLINTVTLGNELGNEFEAVNISTSSAHATAMLGNGFVWFKEISMAHSLAVARLLTQGVLED